MGYDRDYSGTMERHELEQALAAFGYRLSPQTVAVITARYSTNGKVAFDDFVALCVKMRALTGMIDSLCMGQIYLHSSMSAYSPFPG